MSDLADLVARLGDPDEAERMYAAEDIGFLNCPDGVPALVARLGQDPSPAVRNAIVHALNRIEGDAVAEHAIVLLESDDPRIRNQAVDLLRRRGSSAIRFLQVAMRSADRDIRKLVLDVLSAVPLGDTEEIYTAALADVDPNVTITAVENLGRMCATGFRQPIEALLRPDAHPMLLAACLEALVDLGDAGSSEAIRRCFPDCAALPAFLLAPCLKALAAHGSTPEFAELANVLATREAHLRPTVLDALAELSARCPRPSSDERVLEALRAAVVSDDPPISRYQAVRILSAWADRDDVCAFLVECLSASERLVRVAAAESLRSINRPELAAILTARGRAETDADVLQALAGRTS